MARALTDTILVTGAAGTVGSYVVSLAEAGGYRVIASDLTERGIRVPVRGRVIAGDLCSPDFVRRLVSEGVNHVIHTAAKLDMGSDPRELHRINTDSVAALYEASRSAGVRRFMHVSAATLCRVDTKGPLTEDSPVEARGPYAESKLAAERLLQSSSDGPEWTIVRPAPLYGRRGRHFAASLLAVGPMMRLATPVLPRPRGGPLGTMVHAEDVARALLFLLPKAEAVRAVFNVSDGDVMSLGDRLSETFRAYGFKTFPTGPFPDRALNAVGRLFSAPGAYQSADATALVAWRLVTLRYGLKPALRPRMDREALTLLHSDLVVDSARLRALGWRPRFDRFGDGWREVLRWYQAEGWVPRY
jgi:nucleoside-diphosphate-sugar epimerase